MFGKKLLAAALTAAMFLSCGSGALAASSGGTTMAPRTYAAGETSGSCGDAMTWSYNENTSVLTVSGTGEMKKNPWSDFKGSITRVVFSGNITSICDSAFYQCTNLSSVAIPDSVTKIGYSAFKGCKNLEHVTFGANSNLNKLGENYSGDGVFQNCVNLSEITLPNKLTAIQRETFSGCTNLESVTIGSGVKTIGAYAFKDCGNLTAIVIPNGVESIGEGVFRNCTDLSSVRLGSGLLTIGYSAFEGCGSLTGIAIPASVTEIGYSAFKNLKNLKNVTFASGSNLTTLGKNYSGDGVFQGCTSIQSIVLPDKLTEIQRETFSGCSALTSVTIGSSVKSIGVSAFNNCTNLKSVVIPNKVETLGDCAFKNCSNLSSVRLGSGLLSIGYSAFEGCSNLTGIVIPASVTDIDYSAFKNLKNLTSVIFEPNSNLVNLGKNYSGDGVFQGCTGLTTMVIPDKVVTLQRETFSGCTSLESVTVGNHVVTINSYAFNGCIILKEIVLPKALTTVESNAFKNCTALQTVKFTGTQAKWESLKSDGIKATGNECLLNAPKFIYNYSNELPTVSVTATPSTALTEGDSVTFKATATGAGITYQWQYKKAGQTAWSNWSSRTTATTTATANATWDGMQVRCVVKNSAGNSVGSNILTLSVTAKLKITQQPANLSLNAGDTAKFIVKATGTGTLTYQWYYKKAGQTSWSIWKNHTTATTSAVAGDTWDGMQVYCKVKDANGTLNSAAAKISLVKPLTITSHPANVTVNNGQSVSFTVKATGTGTLTYQWYFKKTGGSWTKWNNHTTATTSATANATWDGMKVYCIVTDAAGSTAVSNPATITVRMAPTITRQPQNIAVYAGSTATFTVKATGTGTLQYQWYIRKAGATSWAMWNGHTTASTSATANDTWNNMQVRCRVTDSNGSTYSDACTVTIAAPLKIMSSPGNVALAAGDSVTFTVKASGTGLKYQWYFKKAGQTSWNLWNGRTTASTTAISNATWDEMQVRCLVTDATGGKVYSAAATVYIM